MMSEARLFFCGWLLLPVVSCKFLHKFFYSRNKNRLHVTVGFQKRAHTVSHMCNDACIGVAFLRSKTEVHQLPNRGIGLALHHRCNQPILKCNQQIATTFITFREASSGTSDPGKFSQRSNLSTPSSGNSSHGNKRSKPNVET